VSASRGRGQMKLPDFEAHLILRRNSWSGWVRVAWKPKNLSGLIAVDGWL
jgi:hypothetical protein